MENSTIPEMLNEANGLFSHIPWEATSRIEITRYNALSNDIENLDELLSEICCQLESHGVDDLSDVESVLTLAKQFYGAHLVGAGEVFQNINSRNEGLCAITENASVMKSPRPFGKKGK